jgi:hypothetical protein
LIEDGGWAELLRRFGQRGVILRLGEVRSFIRKAYIHSWTDERIELMEEPSRSRSSEGSTFINQFVNVLYGILLGYGFGDSIREIKHGDLKGVGPIFSSLSVLFTIIVICVYWWDWYKNIGQRVESNAREFALDIAILVSLESLFFVYERPIAFSFVFFVLSLLSLAWVVNYHLSLYRTVGYSKWSEYINENPNVKRYVLHRVSGIGLFGFCLLLTILLSCVSDQNYLVQSWIGSDVWFKLLQGNWLELLLIVLAFALNRILFFKRRPGLEENITRGKTVQQDMV